MYSGGHEVAVFCFRPLFPFCECQWSMPK